ncbi:MAG: glycosyltransferase family 9 protein [Bacteriovorax sp.]|nr:glycosyltransferase family 9 protein [Bacteriovorax sp.]
MKNILIINLRRIGDVYTTGHLINSLSKTEGNAVSLLVYKESAKAASYLKNVTKLHQIDRKEIITLKTNKLFSDGFALEQLFTQLQEIKKQKWDEIINYSNDLVGAYLCSYLRGSTEKVIGVHFNEQRNIVTNNDWELLFNDVLPVVKYSPIHFIDCYHKMIGISQSFEGEKLITNPSHNSTALNSVSTIRKNQSVAEASAKIVAIQLKTSDEVKDIPEEMLVELISLLKNTSELVPVLLIAPTDEERKIALDINSKFENDLVIIEADLQALASVLMNVDLLITPDTAVKHIANLTNTSVLEISLGYSPFLKQGSYSADSLVLTDIIIERNFVKSNLATLTHTNISAQDIMASVLYFFSKTKSIRPRLSNNVTLYTCSFDQLGARYSVVAGSINAQAEIHRLMSRQLINSIYDHGESAEIYTDVIDFGSTSVTSWCKKEKSNLTDVMKDLLGTLRSLLQCQEHRKSSKDFVINLGKLISHSENNSIMQIPVTMFKTKIESINAKTFEENAKEVEVLLYELKSDIQKVLQCIRHLEDQVVVQRKDDFMNRIPEQTNN